MITGPAGWFEVAVNCHRDGSMGDIDADGYCSRCWYSAYIEDGYFEGHLRPATWFEVKKYLELTKFESIRHYEPSPEESPYKLISGLFYDSKRNRFYGMKIQAL